MDRSKPGQIHPPREDRASRSIKALPSRIYAALTEPAQLARWLPPGGATAVIDTFDVRVGGKIRMTLTFHGTAQDTKTTANTDVVNGVFLQLERDRLVQQSFDFESDDPRFSGTMIMTWLLVPHADYTEVEVTASNVPSGISEDDHRHGMNSSLDHLARLLES